MCASLNWPLRGRSRWQGEEDWIRLANSMAFNVLRDVRRKAHGATAHVRPACQSAASSRPSMRCTGTTPAARYGSLFPRNVDAPSCARALQGPLAPRPRLPRSCVSCFCAPDAPAHLLHSYDYHGRIRTMFQSMPSHPIIVLLTPSRQQAPHRQRGHRKCPQARRLHQKRCAQFRHRNFVIDGVPLQKPWRSIL